ncbi:hypothetical protein [Streptomyces tubercidicus]
MGGEPVGEQVVEDGEEPFGGRWAVAVFGLDRVPMAAVVVAAVALPATWATRWLQVPAAAAVRNGGSVPDHVSASSPR